MSEVYSDLNPNNPDTGPHLYTGAVAVKQVISNIFNIDTRTAMMAPTKGTTLRRLLFRKVNDDTALLIKQTLDHDFTRQENRARFDAVRTVITPDPINNKYSIQVYYDLVGVVGQRFVYLATLPTSAGG